MIVLVAVAVAPPDVTDTVSVCVPFASPSVFTECQSTVAVLVIVFTVVPSTCSVQVLL